MGGLQTSASDYARFVAWLLSAWPPRDAAEAGPLKRSTIREMVQGSGFAERRERALDGRPCPQSVTYGMGMRVFADCELGVALNHGGGLPGFGSGVLLLPERGVGLFVFGNRTYGGGSEALWRAASVLLKAGLLPDPPSPVSSALAEAHAAARLAYRRGDVLAVRGKLAANFLMDRSAEGWRRDLAAIRAKVGACDRDLPVRPRGAMSASFRWLCERGAVDGEILLAPTRATAIQKLQLTVAPPPPPE
jgi:CubicO group peptidase (beta-lactamase class C family)